MKLVNKFLLGILVCVSCCILVACGQVSLNTEQQVAYNEVVSYASSCSNVEDVLSEIKSDIAKVNSEEKLENEVQIGKLKIDIIKIQEKANKDIDDKERTARVNKANYKSKRDSITNKYSGSLIDYNNEKSSLNSSISAAYASYMQDVNRINSNPSLGTGYKEQYRNQRYNQYVNEIRPYQNRLSALETQWKNKTEYDKYNELYNGVDAQLERDKTNIENKRDSDISAKQSQINILIGKR